jgi:hypothetical protein
MIPLTPNQAAAAKDLVATDVALLPLFSPLEKAFIMALKEYFKS